MNEVPRLVNDELDELVEKLRSYQDHLSTAVYEQFKSSLVLSKTKDLRGKTGDAFKEYMEIVHINLAEKVINIVHELHEAANTMQADFLNYEKNGKGIVGSTTVENVKTKIENTNKTFTQLDAKSSQLLNRAAEFISTVKLPTAEVNTAYINVTKNIDKTRSGLDDNDARVARQLNSMKQRVEQLSQQITDLSEKFRDKNGLIYSKIGSIKDQAWYTVENKGAFAQMVDDDPFIYNAGHASVADGQWVTGVDGDIYFAASGYALGAEGYYQRDGYEINTAGEFAALKGSLEGQATDYVTGSIEGELLGGDGSFTFGSEGLDAEGSVAVAKAEGTAMLGTDMFHGYVTGKADALTADGKFAVKIPQDEDGDFKFALGGEASAASAKVEAGITLFGIEEANASIEDGDTKSSKSLLGVDAEVSAGFQASAGVEFSSETVFTSDFVNVRANTIEVDLSLIIGLKIELQIPSIQLKWPW